ncbi:MAG: UDP-glucose/GDP-mannose dehydrogenase family protein [Deltaproteobacteria bacterium]|nr:UDP-glucose/GDP-mannose dehydrogenase family protein [Deltaproteobacteria bacterium]
MQKLNVSVIGLGKLGMPIAGCIARRGFTTIGTDIDQEKVAALNGKSCPLFEPGLEALLTDARHNLRGSPSVVEAIKETDLSLIIVPTPSNPDGGFSLRYVENCLTEVGKALREKKAFHVVALVSTVMPGSMERQLKPFLEKCSGKTCGVDFGFCYNPEFVALGSVIRDFLNPPFILIGESDPQAGKRLAQFYETVCENKPPIARMNWVSAEITKLSLNAFVTTKISFANMLTRLCDRVPGADIDKITTALGFDKRISPHYLSGGTSFGGPCFPRDNVAMSTFATLLGETAPISEATHRFNHAYVEWLAEKANSFAGATGRVGILGIAYKPGTDVVEQACGLLLARQLVSQGVTVSTYDPIAMDGARHQLGAAVEFARTARECIDKSDVVVVTTQAPEFTQMKLIDFARRPARHVIDCWRIYRLQAQNPGVIYVGLGCGLATAEADWAKAA